MYCPVDGHPCCDDICYGSECLRGGGEMLDRCERCNGLFEPLGCEVTCEGCDDEMYGRQDGK